VKTLFLLCVEFILFASHNYMFLPASCWFLAWLILRPRRWRRYVPLKRQFTFSGLQGSISQKIEIFITTAVRTLNPTCVLSFQEIVIDLL
jgi:hypothetical protein